MYSSTLNQTSSLKKIKDFALFCDKFRIDRNKYVFDNQQVSVPIKRLRDKDTKSRFYCSCIKTLQIISFKKKEKKLIK